MNLTRRLIGVSAIFSPDGKVVDVDINGLVHRLLLFDQYVLVTIRLQEFPFIARYLGYEGLRDLLAARIIEIRCECLQLTQVGQSGLFGDPILPYFSYRFNWIDASDRRKYVHDGLQQLHETPGLQHKQVVKLKRAIAETIRPLPSGIKPELWPPFENELQHNPRLVRKAVEMVVQSRLGLTDVPFSMVVHREGQEIFKVETDLHRVLAIGEQEAHKIIEAGLMGVAGLSQSLMEMKAYSAISGFRDDEVPLFRHKLDFLADSLSSQTKEKSFRRVIELAGLPEFHPGNAAVNVDKLLRARESSEAREFRDWLGGISEASDYEIKQRVASLRTRAGVKVGGAAGKAMRFLITTGLGLIPPAMLPALGLSVVDQFILDKLLPRSGIAAFVNDLYLSIFKPITMN